MVKAAHDKKMKVLLDIVTNHMGQVFYYDINMNGEPDERVGGNGCQQADPNDRTCKVQSSGIAHVNEVLAVDPVNSIALGLLYAAQKESGDNAGAVATLLRLQKADPSNTARAQQVAEALAQLDPKQALPLLDTPPPPTTTSSGSVLVQGSWLAC